MNNGIYPIVRIRWQDAVTSSEAGWTTKEDAFSTAESAPPHMSTVGYILYENDDWISLTDSIGGDEFGQVTKIPTSMIIEKHTLVEKPNETINRSYNPADYNSNF